VEPTPLTILSPVPWWWALWIRLSWPAARRTRLVAKPLRDLSFIHFAHWSLIARWPRDRAARRDRAAAPTLLFLTTFDGSDIQYIDAFVRIVPWRIRGLYGGATGFPGAKRFRPVDHYIHERAHPVGHFWYAHPGATTTMIAQALELQERYQALERRVEGADADRFAAEWKRFVCESQELL